MNDLEQPAFDNLPELKALKGRLIAEGGPALTAVFMTGSGSTIVCAGSDARPAFLGADPALASLFIAPARLITRQDGQWYAKSKLYS